MDCGPPMFSGRRCIYFPPRKPFLKKRGRETGMYALVVRHGEIPLEAGVAVKVLSELSELRELMSLPRKWVKKIHGFGNEDRSLCQVQRAWGPESEKRRECEAPEHDAVENAQRLGPYYQPQTNGIFAPVASLLYFLQRLLPSLNVTLRGIG